MSSRWILLANSDVTWIGITLIDSGVQNQSSGVAHGDVPILQTVFCRDGVNTDPEHPGNGNPRPVRHASSEEASKQAAFFFFLL
jgi:hypothetical protein